jgi:DNA-binding NtrC family response regulator
MSGRLTLINEDRGFAELIQAQLEPILGEPARLASYASCWEDSGPETEGLWVLAAGSRAEAVEATYLVQAARLQEWPVTLLVVEQTPALDALDPHITGRFRWPEDAPRMTDWVRAWARRQGPPREPVEPSVRELLCTRLLRQTPSLLPWTDYLVLAAAHDLAMLLTGETGTGKTYLARVLHESSPRKHQPFVVVPCGALPPTLVESTFFGHVRGAFTGADRTTLGKFAVAGEGTILLDEIDTLGLKEQASLLRVIETGEFEQLGSNETQKCRARIIVASNWSLEDAVAQGKFRQDLYYRLNVLSLDLPPLCERLQDILPLARAMAARFARQYRKSLFSIHPHVLNRFLSFPWPGNIRQLQNVVQQAVLVSDGSELLPEHLPQSVSRRDEPPKVMPSPSFNDSLLGTRQMLERAMIQRALENAVYSRAGAARSLGISRVTLYKKLKKYGLEAIPHPTRSVAE